MRALGEKSILMPSRKAKLPLHERKFKKAATMMENPFDKYSTLFPSLSLEPDVKMMMLIATGDFQGWCHMKKVIERFNLAITDRTLSKLCYLLCTSVFFVSLSPKSAKLAPITKKSMKGYT